MEFDAIYNNGESLGVSVKGTMVGENRVYHNWLITFYHSNS